MEKLGIEKLSEAIIAAVNLGENVESKLDDGKLTAIEAVQVAIGSFGSIIGVVKSAGQIKAEFADLDDVEKESLVELIKNELDLANDKVEQVIEAGIEFLLAFDKIINVRK